jgi:hypothetical protein
MVAFSPGIRTLGCCAHVAAVLYYLGMARHSTLKLPAEDIFDTFINCGGVNYNEFDESEDEDGYDSDEGIPCYEDE